MTASIEELEKRIEALEQRLKALEQILRFPLLSPQPKPPAVGRPLAPGEVWIPTVVG